MVVSLWMWVLGGVLRSSGRALRAFSHLAVLREGSSLAQVSTQAQGSLVSTSPYWKLKHTLKCSGGLNLAPHACLAAILLT